LIKGTIYQEETTILKTDAPNCSTPNFIKQTLLDIKAHIETNTTIMVDLNTPFSATDMTWRQKSQEPSEFNSLMDQME
jgi:hypothetical protein